MIDFSQKINIDNLHHGYLIVGDRGENKKSFFDFLENKLKIKTIGNPDFSFFDFNTLTIDEARDLAIMQTRKGFGQAKMSSHSAIAKDDDFFVSRKFFVISTNIITEEAQNALLKVFEEPTEGTHFFILVSQNTFLPTFLSRLLVIDNSRQFTVDGQESTEILNKNIVEKLALVAKIAGDITDEKKVKQDAIQFVSQIENELIQSGGVEKYSNQLKACEFARTTLFSRGAMVKMILENLMLQIL
jgi:hypothetical protein